MRWDFGYIYKQIRQSKGLTQAEICGEEVARSTLANFERGVSTPNFETMVFFLNQLDMSLEEFRYICHEYHPSERQDIIYRLQNLPTYPRLIDFEELLERCRTYLSTHHDVPISHFADLLVVYIQLYKGKNPADSKVLQDTSYKIWSYLEKQDTWYESDLRLLRTILYSFPVESLADITDKIVESLKKYTNYRNIKPLQIALLTNLSNIYFHANLLEECEKMTLMTIELSKQIKHYVYLATAYIRLGICRKEDEFIQKGRRILQLTDETDLLKRLEVEIKKYR